MKTGALQRKYPSQRAINEGPQAMNTALLISIMYRGRGHMPMLRTQRLVMTRKKKIEEARDRVG
jgi:hypothetical protein